MTKGPGARFGPSLLAFVVASCVLVMLGWEDRRPRPVYLLPWVAADAACAITAETPLTMEMTLLRSPTAIVVPVAGATDRAPLRIEVTAPGARAARTIDVTTPGLAVVDTLGFPAGRIRLAFTAPPTGTDARPRLTWMAVPPKFDAVVEYAGVRVERGPSLEVEYPWPSRLGLVLWALPLLVFPLAWRSERWVPTLVVVLASSALVTSGLYWQRGYTDHYGHWDADDYGRYAESIVRWVSDPAARSSVRAWVRGHAEAYLPLAPTLMALPIALGVPRDAVYVEFSSLAGFASLWLIWRLVRVRLGLPHRVALMMLVSYGCHLLVLRSFARAVTDMFGQAVLLATLDQLLAQLGGAGSRRRWVLATLGLANVIARPPGIGYLPFIGLVVALTAWRKDRWSIRAALTEAARVVLPAVAVFGCGVWAFGWTHNLALYAAKLPRFRAHHTLGSLGRSLVGLLQCAPLLWGRALWRRFRDPRLLLLGGWTVYYLAMLVVAQAPFWLRHFLPLLPCVVAFTGVALAERRGRLPLMGVAAWCMLNVGMIVYQIFLRGDVPPALQGIIASS